MTTLHYQQEHQQSALAAPGVSDSISFAGWERLSCAYTVAAINTSVTVRVEGQIVDGGEWVSLHASRTDDTVTANGTYLLTWEGCAHAVRLRFVSEAGGTAATITPAWRFSA